MKAPLKNPQDGTQIGNQESERSESRRQLLFLVLGGFFLTNAVVAEVVGGKLFSPEFFGRRFLLSVGSLLWPFVFVTSDIINEYFGRKGVRKLSILGAFMIAYAFIALTICGVPKAAPESLVSDASYESVFFQSRWIIVGSIAAFLLAQLLDVTVFWMLRRRTGRRLLWVRATGSTLVSQLIDTFVVGFIGLHLPSYFGAGGLDFKTFLLAAWSGYQFKFAVAILVTPLLYLAHNVIDRWLGEKTALTLMTSAATSEEASPPPRT